MFALYYVHVRGHQEARNKNIKSSVALFCLVCFVCFVFLLSLPLCVFVCVCGFYSCVFIWRSAIYAICLPRLLSSHTLKQDS